MFRLALFRALSPSRITTTVRIFGHQYSDTNTMMITCRSTEGRCTKSLPAILQVVSYIRATLQFARVATIDMTFPGIQTRNLENPKSWLESSPGQEMCGSDGIDITHSEDTQQVLHACKITQIAHPSTTRGPSFHAKWCNTIVAYLTSSKTGGDTRLPKSSGIAAVKYEKRQRRDTAMVQVFRFDLLDFIKEPRMASSITRQWYSTITTKTERAATTLPSSGENSRFPIQRHCRMRVRDNKTVSDAMISVPPPCYNGETRWCMLITVGSGFPFTCYSGLCPWTCWGRSR